MKVYVIWIEYQYDDPDDNYKITKVVSSEDSASLWCSDYNDNFAGHSSAYYDEFYVEDLA